MTDPLNTETLSPNEISGKPRSIQPARPHAIRKDREILIPSGKVMLVFSTAIEAREYSEVLHATHFVCQTSEPWRHDETAGVLRLPMHGKHRLRVMPNGQRIDLDVKR